MNRRKLLQKILGGSKNIRFSDIPDLEACSAFGDTPDEALREVQNAKKLWLEVARAEGKPMPPPKYRPVIYQAVSA